MSELEELVNQKREIEARIKELRTNGVVITENAKLEHRTYRGHEYWCLRVMQISYNSETKRVESLTLFSHESRERVVSALSAYLKDLQLLEAKIKSNGACLEDV